MSDSSCNNLRQLVTTIRTLSIDGVEKANSGHPGLPLGAADFATVCWAKHLNFNPRDTEWPNRDRFILSAGHGSMLLYSLLHVFGYELPLEQLQKFRQWDSKTPGHPEFNWTPGVEATTGPLGQGSANAVGMALSGKMLAARYGADLFNYRVFALVSDGDLMEGVSAEAGSLAAHLELDNLIYLYDDNHISLAGETDVCFTESVPKRYEAYGWHVESVDGHDMAAVNSAIERACKVTGKPKLIACRTTIGFGSPNKKHTHDVHGAPLGKDELALTKKELGWSADAQFLVPDEVRKLSAELVEQKGSVYREWQEKLTAWKSQNGAKAKELEAQLTRETPQALKDELIATFKEGKKDATRNLSGKVIQIMAKHMPHFVGGSADLEPSTKTLIQGAKDVQPETFDGRNIRFGVREHAMGSIVNGMAYTKSWIPYSATFLVFSDYMRPVMRIAALSHIQSLYVFTHDSFWVGEDGPTHEPIEHVMSMRLIPGVHLYRPADGLETAMAYWSAAINKKGPSVLIFTRQNLAVLERPASFTPDDILKGGYVVTDAPSPKAVLVATGSEVALAVDAAKELAKEGLSIRVVSMPCVESFKEQDQSYRESVIPTGLPRISLEAGVTTGWANILGGETFSIGIDHYGASAPGEELAKRFGFSPEEVSKKVKGWMSTRK